MHQSHCNQKTFSLWKLIMGALAVVLMLGTGATLAQAAPGPNHSDLTSDHANLAIDHGGLEQKLDQVLEGINNLGVGVPCGQGTEGRRFVVNGPEVCDNTTGYAWEQTPDIGVFTHAQAITHCQSKGGGWDLPEVQQLGSVVGYGNTNPALPTGHPFTIPAPDATVTSIGYWAATLFAGSPATTGWAIAFLDGDVDMVGLGRNNIRAWCVR